MIDITDEQLQLLAFACRDMTPALDEAPDHGLLAARAEWAATVERFLATAERIGWVEMTALFESAVADRAG